MSTALRARSLSPASIEARRAKTPHELAPSAGLRAGDPLLVAAVAGDETALHALALRILPRVRNAVRYLVRGDAIDDLAQDVLVTVLERLESYRGAGRFESWVDGVTLRVVLGRMRKLRALERRVAHVGIEAVADEAGCGVSPSKYATSRQLVRALDELSDSQRQALVLHHVFGLTVPEIASELAVPHETIRTRLRDGMGLLRALLRVQANRTGV